MLKMADFRVPPASRGNRKEGVFNRARFCKLCPRDWYKYTSFMNSGSAIGISLLLPAFGSAQAVERHRLDVPVDERYICEPADDLPVAYLAEMAREDMPVAERA